VLARNCVGHIDIGEQRQTAFAAEVVIMMTISPQSAC